MSAAWEHLRGKDLSAFIAQNLAGNENEEFAQHLERYGTVNDFNAWIHHPNKQISVSLARSFLPYCPSLAQHILIDALDNDLSATIHLDVCVDLCNIENPDPAIENIRSHINFEKTPHESRAGLFIMLLRAGWVETITAHKDVFAPAVASNPDHMCIAAAHAGWDLAEHFDIIPPSNSDYFLACCVGGLIDRAQQCAIDPCDHQKLFSALTLSLYRKNALNPSNHNSVEYLWDAYPNTPWHKHPQILNFAYEAPVSVLPKIIEHFKAHTPKRLKKYAIGLACRCIEHNDHERFDLFYPLLAPTQHYNVFYTAIVNQNQQILLQLLKQPKGVQNFMKSLEQCEDGEQQWGTAFYSQYQNQVLQNFLHNTPTSQRTHRKL